MNNASLAVILASLTAAPLLADQAAVAVPHEPAARSEAGTALASVLASVSAAASSAEHSPAQKSEQISRALREGIAAALVGVEDPAAMLSIVLDYATGAARVAPGFARAILAGSNGFVSDERIPGAAAMIESAVKTAIQAVLSSREPAQASPSPSAPATPSSPAFGGNTSFSTVSPSRAAASTDTGTGTGGVGIFPARSTNSTTTGGARMTAITLNQPPLDTAGTAQTTQSAATSAVQPATGAK